MVCAFRVVDLASLALKNEINDVKEIDSLCSINPSGVTSKINSALQMEGNKKEFSMMGIPWGSLPVEFCLWSEFYFHGTGHKSICKQKSQKT